MSHHLLTRSVVAVYTFVVILITYSHHHVAAQSGPEITCTAPANGAVLQSNTNIMVTYQDIYANAINIYLYDYENGAVMLTSMDNGNGEGGTYIYVESSQCIDQHRMVFQVCLDSAGCCNTGLFTLTGCTQTPAIVIAQPQSPGTPFIISSEYEYLSLGYTDTFDDNVTVSIIDLTTGVPIVTMENQPNSGTYIDVNLLTSGTTVKVQVCTEDPNVAHYPGANACAFVCNVPVLAGSVIFSSPSSGTAYPADEPISVSYTTEYPAFFLSLFDVTLNNQTINVTTVTTTASGVLRWELFGNNPSKCFASHTYGLLGEVYAVNYQGEVYSDEFTMTGCTGVESIWWEYTNGWVSGDSIAINGQVPNVFLSTFPGTATLFLVDASATPPTSTVMATNLQPGDNDNPVYYNINPSQCEGGIAYSLQLCALGQPNQPASCAITPNITVSGCATNATTIQSMTA